jgi:hypothetical protein
LAQSLNFSSRQVLVKDTSLFADNGLIRVGPQPGSPGNYELIYYDKKTPTAFQNLIRGFAGSIQTQWPNGAWVSSGVMADHHNAIKDAILQIENNLGVKQFPVATSLNGLLQDLERRFLAPKPLFRAFPRSGPPPMKVRFQNFTTGATARFLWDFGDGTTSVEKSPIHQYLQEGVYTVKLNVITQTAAQGIMTKSNYITVSNDARPSFFYVQPLTGISAQTATAQTALDPKKPVQPTVFNFVDQTDGQIAQRFWIFDDSTTLEVDDPNVHTASHIFQAPGTYQPSLLAIASDQTLQRVFLVDTITVF